MSYCIHSFLLAFLIAITDRLYLPMPNNPTPRISRSKGPFVSLTSSTPPPAHFTSPQTLSTFPHSSPSRPIETAIHLTSHLTLAMHSPPRFRQAPRDPKGKNKSLVSPLSPLLSSSSPRGIPPPHMVHHSIKTSQQPPGGQTRLA